MAEALYTAAVADPGLYTLETYDYSDVTDEDLRLYLDSRGHFEIEATEALIAFFGGSHLTVGAFDA